MSSARFRLQKLQSRRTGWPLATFAFYGPSDRRASKLVVSVLKTESSPPDPTKTWRSEDADVRTDEAILAEAFAFIGAHGVHRVAMADRIIGCPHQEGIDYEGRYCPDPACTFWVGRDRWTGQTEH